MISDGFNLVLSKEAAILDLVGSHKRHSLRPSLFRRSFLTEMPFTAFLVQIFLPSFLTPHPKEFTFRFIFSFPFGRFWKFIYYIFNILIDFRNLFFSPRDSSKMINPYGYARFTCNKSGYLSSYPSRGLPYLW